MLLRRGRIVALAALTASCCAFAATAQDAPPLPPAAAEEASASPDDAARTPDHWADGTIEMAATAPLDEAALAEALRSDDIGLGLKPKRPATRISKNEVTWSRNDATDGSSVYSVKTPLSAPWDTSIGADFNLVAPTTAAPGSGAAWANVDVPYVATLGVRAEQTDHSRFGSSLQRTVPIGSHYAVTLQGNIGITELYSTLAPAPVPGSVLPNGTTRIFDTDNSVKFSMRSTGTAFSAGALTSSIDPETHTKLTAEQKIYGPLNVTGSLYDPGKTTSAAGIGAGLKFDW